jgi:hypothetical protein
MTLRFTVEELNNTELTELRDAVAAEITRRENVERANHRLYRAFQLIEKCGLNLVDQETGEVLEFGRVLVQ